MSIKSYILAAVAAMVCLLPARAQTAVVAAAVADSAKSVVDVINASGNIVVEMDSSLTGLLSAPSGQNDAENSQSSSSESAPERNQRPNAQGKIVGYRVQIYADNNVRTAKSEARMRERVVGRAFPYNTYVTYSSPYWRLRVGDFRTQEEAQKAATSIRQRFPKYAREVRVVRDHVYAR